MIKRSIDIINGFLLGIISGFGALLLGMLYGKIITIGNKLYFLMTNNQ